MIQTTEVSITYKGDGVQTSFPYPYPYRNSDDIVGYIINDVGYEKRITNNFKYDKVSNIYQYPLAGDPLAAPYSIKLIRETPQQQNADLPGKLPFSLIEKSLDWIIMILQEIGSRCNSLWHIRNDCKLSETNARNSASAAAESEENIANSENLTKKWAMSSVSPDGVIDTNSPTGYTQSSRSWALYSKEKAQEAATSETNAKASETNAKVSETKSLASEKNAKVSETNAKDSETNAKASETKALTSEQNAKTSETNAKASETKSLTSEKNAKVSETNAKTSETNAANSAKQAAESAGVFQDFKGSTSSSDGNGGKVPKPLAGQQERYLKADGTWSNIDKLNPNTLWDALHFYGSNYVPSDTTNKGWNSLGFASIYYSENKINYQPRRYGQLINIPVDKSTESTQLWVEQPEGRLFYRGGNDENSVNNTPFKAVATTDEVNAREKLNSQGDNWIRYESGLQLCWNLWIEPKTWWSFPVAFSGDPVVTLAGRTDKWPWVDALSKTGCTNKSDGVVCALAVGRWE